MVGTRLLREAHLVVSEIEIKLAEDISSSHEAISVCYVGRE